MAVSTRSADRVPRWIHALGVPVWVSDPAGEIAHVNERAERLLSVSAEECIGLPCHEVVAAKDPDGRAYCGPDCPLRTSQSEIGPVDLCIAGPKGERHWIQVLAIPIEAPERNRPWLIHCAVLRDKSHRIEEYVSKIAERTVSHDHGWQGEPRARLTRREQEILELLAEDHDLRTIADQLCISYTTVRNHVQHMLAKLHVHSIIEAVAYHLAKRPTSLE